MQLSSDTDTVSFWMDDAFVSQLEDFASHETSETDLSAKLILELNDEILDPKPEILEPYDVVEIDLKPTGEPIYNKTGKAIELKEDLEETLEFIAYPNPFDQSISFTTGNRLGELYVFDIRGQLLNQQKVTETITSIQGETMMTPGVYIVIFKPAAGSEQAIRVIKQ